MRDVAIPVPGGSVNVWHRPASSGAETVVMVHGLTGTSRWWTRVIDELSPDLGIVAMDVRGRGRSADCPAPYHLAEVADDIERSLDVLDVDRAVVAGYSMGAWIVAVFAERHPDRVTRLVLIDGGLALPNDPLHDPDDIIEAVVGPSLSRLERNFADEEEFFDYWKAHPALERHWDEEMRAALSYELSEGEEGHRVVANPEAIRESARQITVDPTTRAVAENVKVPSHLIVVERGTADQPGGMIPHDTAVSAVAANPMLTMEYLEGINHYTLVLGQGASAVAAAISGG